MDHEGKRLTGNNNRVSETYKQLLEWYGTGRSNATTQILDELERTKVIEISDSVTDYATFKSKLDQMFSQLEILGSRFSDEMKRQKFRAGIPRDWGELLVHSEMKGSCTYADIANDVLQGLRARSRLIPVKISSQASHLNN
jgi:hypothetical protein